MFFIHLKKNKGSALLTVIVVMAVLIILGMGILTTSVSETRQTYYLADKVQANYLARTAVDDVAYAVMDNPDTFSSGLENTTKELGNSMEYDVEVITGQISIGDYNDITAYEIFGTGRINNASSEVKVTAIEATLAMLMESAVYSNSTIDIDKLTVIGGVSVLKPSTIEGYNPNSTNNPDHSDTEPLPPTEQFDDGYYAIVEHYYYYDRTFGATHEGGVPNGTLGSSLFPSPDDIEPGSPHGRNAEGEFKEPLLETIDRYAAIGKNEKNVDITTDSIDSSGYYGNIAIGNNRTLTIDTDGYNDIDEPLVVVVDRISLSPNGKINVTGDGYLNLYVRDGIKPATGGSYSSGEFNTGKAMVNIFAVGDSEVTFQTPSDSGGDYDKDDNDRYPKIFLDKGSSLGIIANGTVRAYVIGPSADIHMQSHAKIVGFVIGDLFTGGGIGGQNDTPLGTVDFIPPSSKAFEEIDLPIVKWFYERVR